MPDEVAQAEPAAPAPADPPASKWDAGALVISGGAIPAGEKRGVIVAEARGDDGDPLDVTYPVGADFYLRHSDECDFGAKRGPFLTMGEDLEQGALWGFSITPGIVHVGPAHPAYAAANLAVLQGAKDIEIRGLSETWKSRLRPWVAGFGDESARPAAMRGDSVLAAHFPSGVTVKLT